ncbi:hypothetical protein WJX72_004156 [[Myrmecia] bisecta]|uniref:Uncharacterized protein n=1 Tax=[Myrmecia] bisecta TaxID=41462 RepID=A0AAW1Q1A5_9CHLO
MSSEKLLNVMVELRAARRASQTAERQDASREALRDETGELAVAEDEDLGHSSAHRALLSSVHQAKASVAEHKGRLESRDRTISNLQDWVQNVAQRTQTGDLQQLAEEALEGFDADQYEAEDAQHAQQGLGRRSSSAAGLGAELKAHWQSSVDEEALKRATAMHEAWKAEMGMEMAEMSHLRESVRSLKDQLQSSRAEVRQLKFLDRVRKMRSVSESGGASNPDEPQLPEGEGSLPMDLGPSRNSSLGEPMPRSRLAAGGSDQYVRELQAQVANLQQQLQRAMEGGGGANPNPGRPPHPSLPRSRLSDSGCSSSTEATLPKPASAIFSIAEAGYCSASPRPSVMGQSGS